jgi:hypothetical protein
VRIADRRRSVLRDGCKRFGPPLQMNLGGGELGDLREQ